MRITIRTVFIVTLMLFTQFTRAEDQEGLRA